MASDSTLIWERVVNSLYQENQKVVVSVSQSNHMYMFRVTFTLELGTLTFPLLQHILSEESNKDSDMITFTFVLPNSVFDFDLSCKTSIT